MDANPPFERLRAAGTPHPQFACTHLAVVEDVSDPDGLNRVQIRVLSCDGPELQDGPLWARVATSFAGPDRGAVFIPDVGDEVLISFVNGDPRFPIVVGSLWNGNAQPPETIDNSVDRWMIVSKAGARIAIVEDSSSTITLETPQGVKVELTDSGSSITVVSNDSEIVVKPGTIDVTTGGSVSVSAATVDVSAGSVNVDSAIATFSGTIQCQTIIATTVVGTTYTPGAGNVW